MTIREILLQTITRLEAGGIESARFEAEWMITDLLGISKTELYLRSPQEFSARFNERLQKMTQARLQGRPLQYLLGYTEFYGRRFFCDDRALIPRPETEILVETTLSYLKKHFSPQNDRTQLAWDIGTGGGNIAVTLAAELPGYRVLATDIDRPALQLAQKNITANQIADRVFLHNCSLFESIKQRRRFVVICSNPPYVSPSEADTLPREVRDFEPTRALFAPEGGLSVLKRIIADAGDYLAPGGLLALEIGYDQADAVKALFANYAEYVDVKFTPDLAGHLRVVTAVRN